LEYLQSEDWQWKREKRLLLDGNKCRICGRPFDLNVHHMTYKNWPNENMTDLITLCNRCHKAIEAEKKYGSDDSFAIVARAFVKLFIKEYAPRDY
jgi:5-methylcytosine-specific restriction endonuclease McrA